MSDVSLKEYLETQINWVDRHFASQITTIQEKTQDAREQIDQRLKGMNEFRDTLRDQAGRLATIDSVYALKDQLDQRLKLLEMNKANFEGKAAIVSTAVALCISILIAALSHYFR